jgi:hypothetical protein
MICIQTENMPESRPFIPVTTPVIYNWYYINVCHTVMYFRTSHYPVLCWKASSIIFPYGSNVRSLPLLTYEFNATFWLHAESYIFALYILYIPYTNLCLMFARREMSLGTVPCSSTLCTSIASHMAFSALPAHWCLYSIQWTIRTTDGKSLIFLPYLSASVLHFHEDEFVFGKEIGKVLHKMLWGHTEVGGKVPCFLDLSFWWMCGHLHASGILP